MEPFIERSKKMKRIGAAAAFAVLLGLALPVAANVVVNGDFEQGNTGFVTEYAYVAPPPAAPPSGSSYYLNLDGQYTIYPDPNTIHSKFAFFGDHTSGLGNMLLANGAGGTASANVHVVWQQTVPVVSDTDYVLTYWIANCVLKSPAQIQCSINGVVGGADTVPETPGEWMQVTYYWNSGSSTEATIALEDLNREASGNDFAIDDISLDALDTMAVPISIDVKPGSDTNTISLNSNGMLSVAILGSETMSVADIDQTTLLFAGAAPHQRGNSGRLGSFDDVNGDGLIDLVVQFPVQEMDLTEGDSEATLTGLLDDGTPIEGTDSVDVQ
jgi:hypothetical protein